MPEQTNNLVDRLFDLANSLGPPLVQQLGSKKGSTVPAMSERLNETLRDAQLNGSGPADLSLAAKSAPQTLTDDILGRTPATPATAASTSGLDPTIILVGFGLIFLLLFIRR